MTSMPFVCKARETDIEAILAISAANDLPEYAMTMEDIVYCQNFSHFRIYVADREGTVVGFIVFNKDSKKIILNHICVRAGDRLQGVGALLVGSVISRLSKSRTHISTFVRESDTPTQKFLQSLGFQAIKIVNPYKAKEPRYQRQ